MNPEDSTFREDVARRIGEGLTPEMAGASRRRFAILQAIFVLVLAVDIAGEVSSQGPSSWRAVVSSVLLVLIVVLSLRRWRRFSPRPGRSIGEDGLDTVVRRSRRCEACAAIVLPGESECPDCGGLNRPRVMLAFGILFGVLMVIVSLLRGGFFRG